MVSCATINYVGKTYSPSKNVDVYYSKDDVKNEHIIMGHAVASGSLLDSAHDVKIKLIQEARIRGADGILIAGFRKQKKKDLNQIEAKLLKYK